MRSSRKYFNKKCMKCFRVEKTGDEREKWLKDYSQEREILK